MKTTEVKHLLNRYFEGESTVQEEQALESYFNSGEVAAEFNKYTGLFRGLAELSDPAREDGLENDLLGYIEKHDSQRRLKKARLWQGITGIAASIILVVGGVLYFQQQESQYADTFDDPETAYAYAEQTLSYVSAKYNQGMEALTHFDKLQTASEPLQHGVRPVNEYMDMVGRIITD